MPISTRRTRESHQIDGRGVALDCGGQAPEEFSATIDPFTALGFPLDPLPINAILPFNLTWGDLDLNVTGPGCRQLPPDSSCTTYGASESVDTLR